MKLWVPAALMSFAAAAQAVDQDRFLAKLALPTGQTVVVAEGDFEARSIGSFSVRLYDAAPIPDETTFFTSGLVRPRDGTVVRAIAADVNGDGNVEIVVVIRSAGSGGYQSAQAVAVAKNELVFMAGLDNLEASIDPVEALRRSLKTRD
jgi:Periplasmic lysozyme inhibitor of I-type lysozyme